MNDKFFDLKKEKQDKMINGAMQVFACKGYKNASTDDMVKVAGVSKGLWFHYFVNKMGLYYFVSDYCVKYLNMELATNLAGKPSDYFDILYIIEDTKVQISKIYPFAPLMIQSMLDEKDEEIISIAKELIEPYRDKVREAFENFDESELSSHVSKDMLDMTVGYTVKGIMEKAYNNDVFDAEGYLSQVKAYFDMMRKIVYA